MRPLLTGTTEAQPEGGGVQGLAQQQAGGGGEQERARERHESNKAALRGQTDELLIKDVRSRATAKLQQRAGGRGIINSPSISCPGLRPLDRPESRSGSDTNPVRSTTTRESKRTKG